MKDEEMAELYKADYGIDLCCLCRECEVENINPCQHKKDAMYGYKDGFLAGLKAGRPQWHDLEKDPNDLPKTDKDVIVYRKDSGSDFDYYRGGAWFGNANGYESEQPIAWCEIPTFDKE